MIGGSVRFLSLWLDECLYELRIPRGGRSSRVWTISRLGGFSDETYWFGCCISHRIAFSGVGLEYDLAVDVFRAELPFCEYRLYG